MISSESGASPHAARELLSARAVRKSSLAILDLALAGQLAEWKVDLSRLAPTADYVAQVVRDQYPKLNPPMHARWRHFVFNGRDLWNEMAGSLSGAPRARAELDLAITSVLLDAGAGPTWRYRDEATDITATRSEGLALASLRWFANGGFSSDPRDPLRADAAALIKLDAAALNRAFQVSATNPLVGAEHRAALLNRLGAAMQARPDLFAPSANAERASAHAHGAETARASAGAQSESLLSAAPAMTRESPPGASLPPAIPSESLSATPQSLRLGGLFDHFARIAAGQPLRAGMILETLLEAFGGIWQNRPTLDGVPLGDCWPHPALKARAERSGNPAEGYVALHKLSQWLSYSLIEPLQNAGIAVAGLDELTGLPEYRNGGLLIDLGVIVPRDPAALTQSHLVSEAFVLGWRALTVALLDRLAPMVGERLGLANDSFLLARVLEGGTWAAGRRLAREKRGDGSPPFQILSDGTVL